MQDKTLLESWHDLFRSKMIEVDESCSNTGTHCILLSALPQVAAQVRTLVHVVVVEPHPRNHNEPVRNHRIPKDINLQKAIPRD